MNDKDWRLIAAAVEMVQQKQAKRVDGTCWRVYTAGPMTRIDIIAQGE